MSILLNDFIQNKVIVCLNIKITIEYILFELGEFDMLTYAVDI